MRAVVITKHGPPEVLQVQERPDPHARRRRRCAIDVAAAGINFADMMARVGPVPGRAQAALRGRLRGRGHGAELGDGVDGLDAGERVMAGTQFGGYAEQVVGPGRATSCRCPTRSASSRAPRSRSTTRPRGQG